jgi:hypothetical protein
MVDTTPNPTPTKDWRFPVSMGLAIGVGLATERAVKENLEASLGGTGAFLVSVLATAAVAGLVALIVYRLFPPSENQRK